MLRYGVVESIDDPLKLGRCKVRIIGLHTDNLVELPTNDLPWSVPMQSITSAAMSGIGTSPLGVLPGSWCILSFFDEDQQYPLILGTFAGIPGITNDVQLSDSQMLYNDTFNDIPPLYPPVGPNELYIGQLTVSDVDKLALNIQLSDSDKDISIIISIMKTNYIEIKSVLSSSVPKEKLAGLLKSSHFNSSSITKEWLKTGLDNGTCKLMYGEGYQVIAGEVTTETPTIDNINNIAIDKNSPQLLKTNSEKYDVSSSHNNNTYQGVIGFNDPDKKYPLTDFVGESDIPRLARCQNISKTIVEEKRLSRAIDITVANGSSKWSQSLPPYNAVYPHNKVTVTTSGHAIEFDDTPNAERINIHHKSGTFVETDSSGNNTEVTKGIKTIIIDKDELVYIKGSGHLTIDGDMSVMVKSALQIEVLGDANINTHGSINMKAGQNINFQAGGVVNIKSGGNMNVDSQQIWMNSGKSQDTNITYAPKISTPSPSNYVQDIITTLEDTDESKKIVELVAMPSVIINKDETELVKKIEVPAICEFINLNENTRLTTNYTIKSLCKKGRFNVEGQHNISGKEIACNLKHLLLNVIEPLNNHYADKGFSITSCYRLAGDKTSKSKGISKHELGCAVDFIFTSLLKMSRSEERLALYNIAKEIKNLIPFDRILLEFRDDNSKAWIHVQYQTGQNRNEIFTLNNDKTVGPGFILIQ